MKLYAAQSKEEQVSVLALIETVGSAVAALLLAIYWGTFAPFAISVVIAPLLLLRTRDSTAHGVKLARRFSQWSIPTRTKEDFIRAPLIVVGIYMAPFVIRVTAMILSLLRDSLGFLAALPSNWWYLIARVDTTVAPQVVPGFRSNFSLDTSFVADSWDIRSRLQNARWTIEKNRSLWFTELFLGGPFAALVFLPAWIYRWSLKSTFWIYLPLFWVVQPVRYDRKNVWARINVVRNDRVVLFLSGGILGIGLIKIRIWQMKTAFAGWWDDNTLGQFFKVYVAPDSMPVWQYTSMVNGVLAIAMYFIARSALQSQKEGAPWPDAPLDSGLRCATACRRMLTTYTTVVLVMITLKQGFPPLGNFLPL